MEEQGQSNVQFSRKHRFLQRGESMVASTGLAVAAILLAAMGASGWWGSRTYRQSFQASQQTEIGAMGELLADTSRTLLENGEISSLRRMISDTGRKYELSRCRIVLPDGRVFADSDAASINLLNLPEQWQGSLATVELAISTDQDELTALYALEIPGRGTLGLDVAVAVIRVPRGYWDLQAGAGMVGAFSLIALLMVYRRMRSRLTALGAIREALLAYKQGVTCESALLLSSEFGAEAVAWNQLLNQKENVGRQLVEEKAQQSLGSRKEGRSDLHNACDAMKQGFILIDENLQTKYINGAATVLLQTTREESNESEITSYIKDVKVIEMLRTVVAGRLRRWTSIEVDCGEGAHAGVLRFSARPVRQEDSASAVVLIEDLTQQRVAEESRKTFVAQATHELRTPLTNIRLYVETALDEGENDPVVRAKCLNIINQESRRLERIVGDMLSVSEIEAGSIQLKQGDVRLDTLFEELENDYQAMAQEKCISLKFNLPPKLPVLRGDRDKIVLAMHNLLGNALKYTHDNGQVEVTVNADEQELVFEVSDSGIGIDSDEFEMIFDKFYRAKNSRESKATGSGLGLALAREVVRLHGGDIKVESELNRGSKFIMTIPIMAEAA